MLSIGDLARRTRVSVRRLRHYDALGLVTPAHVDQRTGYRWCTASQIGRVNALVALEELGFTLEQCGQVLDEQMSVAELIEMLRTRQAELALQIEADTQRLAAAGLPVEGRGIRTYFGRPDGSKIDVAAAVPVAAEVGPIDGVEIVEVAAEETAAAVVHRRPPGDIADAWQTFAVATDRQGLIPFGVHRQVYLHAPEGSDEWVVQLQCPVQPSSQAPRGAQQGV